MSQNSTSKNAKRTPEAMRSSATQSGGQAVQTSRGKQHKVAVVAQPASAENAAQVIKPAPQKNTEAHKELTPIKTRDAYAKQPLGARFGLTTTLALCALVIVGLLMLGQKFQPVANTAKATTGEQALQLALASAKNEDWRALLQHVNIPEISDSLASQLADAPDSAYASQDDLKKQLNVDMTRIGNGVVKKLPANSPVKVFMTQLTGDKEVSFGRLNNVKDEGDVVRGDVSLERPDLLLTSRLEAVAERQEDGSWQLVDLPNVVDVLREVEAVKRAHAKPAPLLATQLGENTISATLKAPQPGAVIAKVPYMQDIRTKALPAKGGKLPLELAITFNNATAQKANMPWRVTFKDKAGQVLGAYQLDAQDIAQGSGQKHTWNIALPNTGKARHIHALPLGAMVVSLVPLG